MLKMFIIPKTIFVCFRFFLNIFNYINCIHLYFKSLSTVRIILFLGLFKQILFCLYFFLHQPFAG